MPLYYLAQTVSNIKVLQEGQNIVVTYNLETPEPCIINLFVSTNNGNTWQGPLKQVQGQVGENIKSGNNSITFFVLNEFNELRGENIKFKIEALNSSLTTIKIGAQIWTSKNLDVSNYRNGDPIPQVQDAEEWSKLTTGAWCYYENKADNGKTYGKLYNWYAVNDSRGLAPKGFHISSSEEWNTLSDYLVGASVAGAKMKSKQGWFNEGNGTNSSAFSGLPAGYRCSDGTFDNNGYHADWWSSTEDLSGQAWVYFILFNFGDLFRDINFKTVGLSVRCIKD
jgi:uncharacterized protein (TIGR02145 family)